MCETRDLGLSGNPLLFEGQVPVDKRVVCSQDVEKVLLKQARVVVHEFCLLDEASIFMNCRCGGQVRPRFPQSFLFFSSALLACASSSTRRLSCHAELIACFFAWGLQCSPGRLFSSFRVLEAESPVDKVVKRKKGANLLTHIIFVIGRKIVTSWQKNARECKVSWTELHALTEATETPQITETVRKDDMEVEAFFEAIEYNGTDTPPSGRLNFTTGRIRQDEGGHIAGSSEQTCSGGQVHTCE